MFKTDFFPLEVQIFLKYNLFPIAFRRLSNELNVQNVIPVKEILKSTPQHVHKNLFESAISLALWIFFLALLNNSYEKQLLKGQICPKEDIW